MKAVIKYFDNRLEVWVENHKQEMIKHLVQLYPEEGRLLIPREYYDYYNPVTIEDHRLAIP